MAWGRFGLSSALAYRCIARSDGPGVVGSCGGELVEMLKEELQEGEGLSAR